MVPVAVAVVVVVVAKAASLPHSIPISLPVDQRPTMPTRPTILLVLVAVAVVVAKADSLVLEVSEVLVAEVPSASSSMATVRMELCRIAVTFLDKGGRADRVVMVAPVAPVVLEALEDFWAIVAL